MFFFKISILSLIILIGVIPSIENVVAEEDPNEDIESQLDRLKPVEKIMILRQKIRDVSATAMDKCYLEDLTEFLQGDRGLFVTKFLAQSSYKVGRAAKLAWKTLQWRHKMKVRELHSEDFPCDIFESGLIFEHHFAPGYKVQQNKPAIWIRLGALGGVVREKKEKFTAKKLFSSVYHGIKDRRTNKNSRLAQRPLVESMSFKDDRTMTHITRAITWWLEEWRESHGLDAKATLVLDFENTDFAFSSWSMGEFLMSLDGAFPDLFERIVGFRYRPRVWAFHAAISMLNRIFISRFKSSAETDAKLVFVSDKAPDNGWLQQEPARSSLPAYYYGECKTGAHQPPTGCQRNPNQVASRGLIDPSIWNEVINRFYEFCRPIQFLS